MTTWIPEHSGDVLSDGPDWAGEYPAIPADRRTLLDP